MAATSAISPSSDGCSRSPRESTSWRRSAAVHVVTRRSRRPSPLAEPLDQPSASGKNLDVRTGRHAHSRIRSFARTLGRLPEGDLALPQHSSRGARHVGHVADQHRAVDPVELREPHLEQRQSILDRSASASTLDADRSEGEPEQVVDREGSDRASHVIVTIDHVGFRFPDGFEKNAAVPRSITTASRRRWRVAVAASRGMMPRRAARRDRPVESERRRRIPPTRSHRWRRLRAIRAGDVVPSGSTIGGGGVVVWLDAIEVIDAMDARDATASSVRGR